MKRCPVCGAECEDDARHCSHCSYVFPKTMHDQLDDIFKEIEAPEAPEKEEDIDAELEKMLENLSEEEREEVSGVEEKNIGVPASRVAVPVQTRSMEREKLRSMDRGRVNGLTNGLTNGMHRERKHAVSRRVNYKQFIVPVIVAVLIIAAFTAILGMGKTKINIDGDMSDWAGARRSAFSAGTVPPQIDITNASIESDEKYLYFMVEVKGRIFAGDGGADGYMDILHIFIDADRNPETGYYVRGIGAEYVVNVGGVNGEIQTHELYKFDSTKNRFDWEAKNSYGSIDCANSENAVEIRMLKKLVFTESENVEVLYHMFSYNGAEDYADYIVSTQYAPLYVKAKYVAPEVLTGTAKVMEMTMEAPLETITVNAIQVSLKGNATTVDLGVSAGSAEITWTAVHQKKEIPLGLRVDKNTPASISMYLNATAVPQAAVVGIEIESRNAVIASGVVTLEVSQEKNCAKISYVERAPTTVHIDGAFADWEGFSLAEDDADDAPASYDIRKFGAAREMENVAFYLSVEDAIFMGAEVPFTGPTKITHNVSPEPVTPAPIVGMDYVRIYIAQENITFGYYIHGLFANYLIEVIGIHGKILNASLFAFAGSNLYDNRWTRIATPSVASDLYQLEIMCQISGNLTIVFECSDWNKSMDWSKYQTSVAWRTTEIIPMAYTQLVKVTEGTGSSAERFGYSITYLGDVNGDGIGDIAISAPYADYSSRSDCGAVYVFYGYRGLEYANINPANANITIYGNNSGDNFGWNVTSGDLDGNGVNDLVIGAPNASNATARPGRVYIVYNAALSSPKTIDVSGYPYGIKSINGSGDGDKFGWSVALGNTNGAGVTDLTVGAPGAGQDVYSTNFDGDTDESWTHYNTGGLGYDEWQRGTTSNPAPHSGTKCWGTNLAGNYANQYSAALQTPEIRLPEGALYMSFWTWRDFQGGAYDGGLIEIATSDDNFATWTQINMHQPFSPYPHYNGTIASTTNPLYGKEAWYNDVQAWYEINVLLADYSGKTVKFRFHFGSDSATVARGWYIDDFRVWGTAGRTYVFCDGIVPQSARSASSILAGAYPNEQFGYSVSAGGDMDNDGKNEVAVGSPNYRNYNADTPRGRVSVFSGNAITPSQCFLDSFESGEVNKNIVGWGENSANLNMATTVISPVHSGSRAVRLAGNVNYIAYIIKEFDMRNRTNVQLSWWWCSSGLDQGEGGQVYVLSEDRWFCLLDAVPPASPNYAQVTFNLSKYFYLSSFVAIEFDIWANANNEYIYIDDVALTGVTSKKVVPTTTSGAFGTSAIITPSLNGDAYADLLVGAPYNDAAKGAVSVYYSFPNAPGVSDPCAQSDFWSGYIVDSSEYLAQAFIAPKSGYLSAVELFCWDTGTDSTAMYVSVNATSAGLPGSAISSTEAVDFSSLGEWKIISFSTPPYVVQGSKYWIVGVNYDTANNGYVWVADNSNPYPDAGSTFTSGGAWQAETAEDQCFIVHYAPNATITGASAGSYLGFSLAYLDDFNGNGSKDFSVGAPGASGTGAIYVFDGNNIRATMTTTDAEYYYLGSSGSLLGWSIATLGDINGDTYRDLGAGAPVQSSQNGYSVVVSTQVHEIYSKILLPVASMVVPLIIRRRRTLTHIASRFLSQRSETSDDA